MHSVKIWKPVLDIQEIPVESDTNHPVSKGRKPCKDNIPKHSITSWSNVVSVLLCSALVWPQHCNIKEMLLKSIQKMTIKMVKALERKLYQEWLRSLGLYSLEKSEGKPHHNLHLPPEEKKD
ncbi:hypothetical protein DUI87_08930 [Hirundo rustica rustica]|uniref:Uncharacterized protein n=1 Tax=Hirundo rustica rustica TaxID=333673 RepID=A0A3M0L3B0_HIRRU|nr:hypothetical protein DUI87_08930 [Hirundo rustica rustica]